MIQITSCGHDSHHPKACDVEHKNGLPDYLLLLVKTDAWFYVDGRRTFTEPQMAILFDPHTPIHYGCNHPDYNDDWVHFQFDDPQDESLFTRLGIPRNRPLYLPDIHRLSRYVQLLSAEYRFPGSYSADVLDSLMRALLHALAEDLAKSPELSACHAQYPAFSRLRTRLYNSPSEQWTAAEMASSLGLSVSYFQHLYKSFFHIPPQLDLIHARLSLAKYYLANSNMTISALADYCGYENELHFMRQFKKFEGCTPSEFRRRNALRG
ncbi:MAG: AraC family transcriptional regulator [Eubacteriales bacterium]|nr:AraC family transcriptional regulator [Eubacteriales bacterium]